MSRMGSGLVARASNHASSSLTPPRLRSSLRHVFGVPHRPRQGLGEPMPLRCQGSGQRCPRSFPALGAGARVPSRRRRGFRGSEGDPSARFWDGPSQEGCDTVSCWFSGARSPNHIERAAIPSEQFLHAPPRNPSQSPAARLQCPLTPPNGGNLRAGTMGDAYAEYDVRSYPRSE